MPKSKSEKQTDSNASPAAYGWCFQVGAGITLMLDNIKEFTSLKMEGASDDIELTLDSGKIYAQAKSATKIGDRRNAAKNLNNALRILSQDAENDDAVKLIYITNIENPLSSKSAASFLYDRSYEFSALPSDAKKRILDKVGDDFPSDKFQLNILSFFGEGDNKFDSVKVKIAEFLRDAINNPSFNKRLLDSWFETFMVNSADKPDNEKRLELRKKDVIFPVIVLVIDPPVYESDFAKVCDHDNYTEIHQDFREIINRNTYDYEFISAIIADYLPKKNLASDQSSYKYAYVRSEWKKYEEPFSVIKNSETREAVIKLLLLTVIMQRSIINSIKEATNL